MDKILVLGASGQVGIDLTIRLIEIFGNHRVIAADLKEPEEEVGCKFVLLDATDRDSLLSLIKNEKIAEVYHLVAMLSATAEKFPIKGWQLNMDTLFHVLEMARQGLVKKIFWPSSIAVFGPTTPKEHTPQHTIVEPATIYGISKYAGELLCQWYYINHKVDVRSVRYPGIVSWKAEPGGGTTDYAVEIFYQAVKDGKYESFLNPDTELPMMYIDDAINATITLMQAPAHSINIRTSYNLSAISFTPAQLARAIKKHLPSFTIEYKPDYRQQIADSWPKSIDDAEARKDWGWSHQFDLDKMVSEMLFQITKKLKKTV
ncbi:NAD-dependent epimerase/dehydratase family protein [Schleiferia thermophila]|uniref:NAD-dependent epimerase/dehydratase family protein n=1 Tax=Schleiferia thermophila TaxID=884107 RepID=UPI003EEDC901